MKQPLRTLKQHLPRTLLGWLQLSLAIACGLLALSFASWLARKSAADRAVLVGNGEAVTYSVDNPDETNPGDAYAWKGGASDPKKIKIPSIGVDGWIQQVGVDQNQAVAAPSNVHLAGWFVDSVRPGQKGLSIIDGHVSGRTADGIFKRLQAVKIDDEITVESGDGTRKTFVVFDTKTVPTAEAAAVLFDQNPAITSQLNLITCSGSYNREARTYDQRTIIYAKAVE